MCGHSATAPIGRPKFHCRALRNFQAQRSTSGVARSLYRRCRWNIPNPLTGWFARAPGAKAPRRFELMRPRQCYLICATPRTGSTLICETLRLSGLLGVPKEYFEYLKETGLPRQPAQYFLPCEEGGRYSARFLQLLGFPRLRTDPERIAEYRSSYHEYLQRVLNCGTTPNGVFGA